MNRFRLFYLIAIPLLLLTVSCTDEDDDNGDSREKYTGTWNVKDETGGQSQTYNATVSNDPANSSRILIGNIYNLGESASIQAIVAGNSLQLVTTDVSGFRISGSGNYSNNSFTLNYTANDGEKDRAVKATYTR